MVNIGIFCGSSSGRNLIYRETAIRVGQTLAEKGIGIIYGGGKVGLMGAVADAALKRGGRVIGVIPSSLFEHEIAHAGLTYLHVVTNMHERKMKIAAMSDAFITMPGGSGTLEEICEQWTWAQLGLHKKPCAFLNINGFYHPLKNMIHHMVKEGFLRKIYEDMLLFSEDLEEITQYFFNYEVPATKWLD
ncbi:TIGR00730 family Rossman fold protein [Sodalis sp. CWE]|uniref:LOG family protein n=1 Tax=Sodalis sp. CWE TaxID=2803816 RepID=UPI001C7D3920|nr:TIGR00730 family Rossman fold protein [Sodalis sp. CWE]MBX4180963.1 TIGR00730 family Rossman fold protein [Sodalis sp. CWE]